MPLKYLKTDENLCLEYHHQLCICKYIFMHVAICETLIYCSMKLGVWCTCMCFTTCCLCTWVSFVVIRTYILHLKESLENPEDEIYHAFFCGLKKNEIIVMEL